MHSVQRMRPAPQRHNACRGLGKPSPGTGARHAPGTTVLRAEHTSTDRAPPANVNRTRPFRVRARVRPRAAQAAALWPGTAGRACRRSGQALQAQLAEPAFLRHPALAQLVQVLGKRGAEHCGAHGRKRSDMSGAGGVGHPPHPPELQAPLLLAQPLGLRFIQALSAGTCRRPAARGAGQRRSPQAALPTLDLFDARAVVVELEDVAALEAGGVVGGLVVVVLAQVGGAAGGGGGGEGSGTEAGGTRQADKGAGGMLEG